MSCGEGVQTRHVNCTENGTVVDDSVCLKNIPNHKRPKENNTCQGSCCNGVWAVSNWFDVSILAAVKHLLKSLCIVCCSNLQ